MQAYRSVHPAPELWAERRRVVEVVESANAIPEAMSRGWGAYEATNRRVLAELLDAGLPEG